LERRLCDHSGCAGRRPLPEGEKAYVRAQLLALLTEPNDLVAAQLSAAIAKIARQDAPDRWSASPPPPLPIVQYYERAQPTWALTRRHRPELLPALGTALGSAAPLAQLRALTTTLLIAKELVKKRIPQAARQFALVRPKRARTAERERERERGTHASTSAHAVCLCMMGA
jgi:hypothetical protein